MGCLTAFLACQLAMRRCPMTDIDLIVLIAWAIVSAALILACARLQISSGGSQGPSRPAGRAQALGIKPADARDPAPPGPSPHQATGRIRRRYHTGICHWD